MKCFALRIELELFSEDAPGALERSGVVLEDFRRHLVDFVGDWQREIAATGIAPRGGVTGEPGEWRAAFELEEANP